MPMVKAMTWERDDVATMALRDAMETEGRKSIEAIVKSLGIGEGFIGYFNDKSRRDNTYWYASSGGLSSNRWSDWKRDEVWRYRGIQTNKRL